MTTPPLPKPQWLGDIHSFTEAQLLAYRAEVIEMCADFAEAFYGDGYRMAQELRNLK